MENIKVGDLIQDVETGEVYKVLKIVEDKLIVAENRYIPIQFAQKVKEVKEG